jgi:hypothetical protein
MIVTAGSDHPAEWSWKRWQTNMHKTQAGLADSTGHMYDKIASAFGFHSAEELNRTTDVAVTTEPAASLSKGSY